MLSQQQHQEASSEGASEDPLAAALEKFALASEKVGEARLQQDAQIQARYLAGWNTTLNTNLMFAARARKNVENSRLLLDAAKARAKQRSGGTGAQQETVPEEVRLDVEQAEDEFVGQTEEAVSVMKNVSIDFYFPLYQLVLLLCLPNTDPVQSIYFHLLLTAPSTFLLLSFFHSCIHPSRIPFSGPSVV